MNRHKALIESKTDARASEEVTEKYGVLMSPSVVINGVVKYNGKLPDHRVMERIIREAI